MADDKIFDMQQLLDSTCDDKELAVQVVGVFLCDIPMQLKELDKALSGNDAKTAERVAHSIKGAAATVGGEPLRAISYECEQLGRDAKLEELQTLVPELKARYEALRDVLLAEGFVENP